MNDMPYLERVKVQAEILLPLYRRLREEIGVERANALVRAAVHEFATGLGRTVAAANTGTSLDGLRKMMPVFAADDALAYEPLADDERELSLNVNRCAYAEYFQALGETEFGAMLTCEIDPPMTAALGDDLDLERTQTIMRGGPHCDFRWKRRT